MAVTGVPNPAIVFKLKTVIMKYGMELEFFVFDKDNKIVPAYAVTANTDGNPFIGEIRTGVHSDVTDCVFELKKLLHIETKNLASKGYTLLLLSEVKVDSDCLKKLRESVDYVNRKEMTVLVEKSIYPGGKTGKMLPRGTFKASLQINFSQHKSFSFNEYQKRTIGKEYEYVSSLKNKEYSVVFDYPSLIHKLDVAFASNIRETNRIKGVYAIKDGEFGDRIEYRSLPANIYLEKLLEVLQ